MGYITTYTVESYLLPERAYLLTLGTATGGYNWLFSSYVAYIKIS